MAIQISESSDGKTVTVVGSSTDWLEIVDIIDGEMPGAYQMGNLAMIEFFNGLVEVVNKGRSKEQLKYYKRQPREGLVDG